MLQSIVLRESSSVSVTEHAACGNWDAFDSIMARVPDVPPVPGMSGSVSLSGMSRGHADVSLLFAAILAVPRTFFLQSS